MGVIAAYALPHPSVLLPGISDERKEALSHTIEMVQSVADEICRLNPETIFVISPHTPSFIECFHLSGAYGAGAEALPDTLTDGAALEPASLEISCDGASCDESALTISYDLDLVGAIREHAENELMPLDTSREDDPFLDQGVLVPLYYLNQAYAAQGIPLPSFVRCGISGLSPLEHYRFGELIARAAEEVGRSVVVIGSGDLSHRLSHDAPYGYSPLAQEFDSLICDAFASGDFLPLITVRPSLTAAATGCGLRPFLIMVGTLDSKHVRPTLLSYEAPFGVGYAVASLIPTESVGSDPTRDFISAHEAWNTQMVEQQRAHEDACVSLAHQALETYVLSGEWIDPAAELESTLDEDVLPDGQTGVFVIVRSGGDMRAVAGSIMPARSNLAAEICANAVAAAVGDRFSPHITAEELDNLVYEVDVIESPEICTLDMLDPARFGVIVTTQDGRYGILPPALDNIETVEEQVSRAALRGGIALGRDEVRYGRFLVRRHH